MWPPGRANPGACQRALGTATSASERPSPWVRESIPGLWRLDDRGRLRHMTVAMTLWPHLRLSLLIHPLQRGAEDRWAVLTITMTDHSWLCATPDQEHAKGSPIHVDSNCLGARERCCLRANGSPFSGAHSDCPLEIGHHRLIATSMWQSHDPFRSADLICANPAMTSAFPPAEHLGIRK